MEKINYKNSSENINPEFNEEEIDLKDLLNGIIRKKRWLLLTATLFFSGSILFTLHARIFRPVFRGSFTLLISDPMGVENPEKGLYNSNSTLFSDIAIQKSSYQINTLITFLKSSVYLEPIAKEYGISVGYLKKNLFLDQSSGEPGGISEGVLNVNLNFNNRKIGEKILQTLSESYLDSSLEQKQKRLKDGLNFLINKDQRFKRKKDILQSKLVNFS